MGNRPIKVVPQEVFSQFGFSIMLKFLCSADASISSNLPSFHSGIFTNISNYSLAIVLISGRCEVKEC